LEYRPIIARLLINFRQAKSEAKETQELQTLTEAQIEIGGQFNDLSFENLR